MYDVTGALNGLLLFSKACVYTPLTPKWFWGYISFDKSVCGNLILGVFGIEVSAEKSWLKSGVWDEFKFKFDATEGIEVDKGKFEYTGCDIEFANEYTCGFIPVVYGIETLLAFDVEAEVADCMFWWMSHALAANGVVAVELFVY